MGNCIKGQAAVYWADDEEDEWQWADAGHRRRHNSVSPATSRAKSEEGLELLKEEKEEEEEEAPATEVKIKITKKQLEDLLRKVETQGLPLHQLLAHLVPGAYDEVLHDRTRHWRPALQSIPEAAE